MPGRIRAAKPICSFLDLILSQKKIFVLSLTTTVLVSMNFGSTSQRQATQIYSH